MFNHSFKEKKSNNVNCFGELKTVKIVFFLRWLSEGVKQYKLVLDK